MPPTILIVDDEPEHRLLFARILWQAGYTVCTAPDGATALAAVARERPALVIIDLLLPRLPGQVLVAALQRHHPQVRIVVMSALGSGMAIAGVPILAKPFPLANLLACVQDALSDASPSSPSRRSA